ncbi:MAG: carboxypeptidase regulatory-like domain-containing protein, partial [Anaerolineae bacterium]|nr:carboxypeptidase regulatory-like domain-containing protein [Anaerolineae bacterium]
MSKPRRYVWWAWLIAAAVLIVGCVSTMRAERERPANAPAEPGGLARKPAAASAALPTPTPEAQRASGGVSTPAPGPKFTLPIGVIAGVVRDAEGPVAGARVRVKLTDYVTTSAADGTFRLEGLPITRPVSVTAWHEGYYVGHNTGTPGLAPITITMKPHYTTDNLDWEWFTFDGVMGSASCAPCHPSYDEWKADAHGQAGQNPRFLSVYEGTDVHGNQSPITQFDENGYVQPDPDVPYYGPGLKTDYPDRDWNCAACHTPVASKLDPDDTCAWSGCHMATTAFLSDEVNYGVDPANLTGYQADGIGCDFCHKIGEVYLDPKTGLPYPDRPGISSMRIYRPEPENELFFGTHDDTTRRVTYLPLLEESAYCAPCHYGVFNGVVGAPGEVAGGTVVYNSYGEWLESPYSDPETGQTCQDCHMPTVDYDYYVYPEMGGEIRDPEGIHNHLMPGVTDKAFMQNAVTMTATASLEGNLVHVQVSITNDNTGHHVPTGAPMRHLILVVEARDAGGKTLALVDGPVLPAWTGNYAGEPGEAYAKLLKDEWSGEMPTGAYWRPIQLVSDNR